MANYLLTYHGGSMPEGEAQQGHRCPELSVAALLEQETRPVIGQGAGFEHGHFRVDLLDPIPHGPEDRLRRPRGLDQEQGEALGQLREGHERVRLGRLGQVRDETVMVSAGRGCTLVLANVRLAHRCATSPTTKLISAKALSP